MHKKVISLCLSVIILLNVLITPALAAESDNEDNTQTALMIDDNNIMQGDDWEKYTELNNRDILSEYENPETKGSETSLYIRRFEYNPFLDVQSTKWYTPEITYAYKKNLMNGVSSIRFNPLGTMTRGMMITVLFRMFGDGKTRSGTTFRDVSSNAYYKNAVYWGYEKGIVTGTSSSTFAPNDPITRQDAAVMMYRALIKFNKVGSGKQFPSVSNQIIYKTFMDWGQIRGYATEAVNALCVWGILNGDDNGRINPSQPLKRSEGCAILSRTHMRIYGHTHSWNKLTCNATFLEGGGTEQYCDCGAYYISPDKNKPMLTPESYSHYSMCYSMADLSDDETLLLKEILSYTSRITSGSNRYTFRINTSGLFSANYNATTFSNHIGAFFTAYYANYAAGINSPYYNEEKWYDLYGRKSNTDGMSADQINKAVYAVEITVYADKKIARDDEYKQALSTAKQVISGFGPGLSNDKKIQRTLDWMSKRIKYCSGGTGYDSNGIPVFVSAYDALVQKETNCYGYALSTMLFMEIMNIPCHICFGDIKSGGSHAWNIIKTSNGWKYFDACWYSGLIQKNNSSEAQKYYSQTHNPHKNVRGFDWYGNFPSYIPTNYIRG